MESLLSTMPWSHLNLPPVFLQTKLHGWSNQKLCSRADQSFTSDQPWSSAYLLTAGKPKSCSRPTSANRTLWWISTINLCTTPRNSMEDHPQGMFWEGFAQWGCYLWYICKPRAVSYQKEVRISNQGGCCRSTTEYIPGTHLSLQP